MNVHFPAPRRKWPARLVNLAVVIVVLALAAATFVLSYSGLHAIVSQAGVSGRLARIYPGLFDALFVVACVAAVALRDGRWWARWYAWLVIVVVVAVVGAADAAHAMNVTVPHRTIEGVVAAAPWVLVLLGFSLMLTMLRQSRAHDATGKVPAPAAPERPALPMAALPPETAPVAERAPVPGTAPVPVPETAPAESAPAAEAVPTQEPAPVSGATPTPEATPTPDLAPVPGAAALTLVADPASDPAPAPEAALDPEPAPAQEHMPESLATPEPEAETVQAAGTDPAPSEQEPIPAPASGRESAGEGEPAVPADTKSPATRADSVIDEEDLAKRSGLPFWESGEESQPAGQDHQPTVPGYVLDDDAPPFATAPFARVPRLNRVRSTPTPPGDDDEDE